MLKREDGSVDLPTMMRLFDECSEDYGSARLTVLLPTADFSMLEKRLSDEVHSALEWASTYLPPGSNALLPAGSRVGPLPTDNRGPTGATEEVVAFLRSYHADPGATPLTGEKIAQLSRASKSTVTRALKKVFGDGGQKSYLSACESGSVVKKLDMHDGDGRAFSTSDPRKLDR
jgi:hypothetical protein